VLALDIELKKRDGADHLFLASLNKTDFLHYAVVAYSNHEPVGCGALREYAKDIMELKRMFISENTRRRGIATIILNELETWCREMHFKKCILETGKNQPEAIAMYQKAGYKEIPNFGRYKGVASSVCFEKELS
jgi:GNAT superfamily N-acetyltransferase